MNQPRDSKGRFIKRNPGKAARWKRKVEGSFRKEKMQDHREGTLAIYKAFPELRAHDRHQRRHKCKGKR